LLDSLLQEKIRRMPQTSQGLFGKVKFVVYLEDRDDRPNLSDVYLNIYDMVENDFFNHLAKAFSICGFENVGKDFFKRLGQDFLTIGQDIIDSHYEGIEPDIHNQYKVELEVEVKKEYPSDNRVNLDQNYENTEDDGIIANDENVSESLKKVNEENETMGAKTNNTNCEKAAQSIDMLGGLGKTSKSYTCAICLEFTASRKKEIDEHMMSSHQDYKKYHCTDCDYKSNFQMNVKRHIDIKHKGLLGDHLCSYCPKRFFSPAKLKSHTLVHTKEKNFVCEECAAIFKRKDDLKSHKKIHQPEEIRALEKAKRMVHVCETCGKKFEKNWKLKRHMVVHVKSSKYQNKI